MTKLIAGAFEVPEGPNDEALVRLKPGHGYELGHPPRESAVPRLQEPERKEHEHGRGEERDDNHRHRGPPDSAAE